MFDIEPIDKITARNLHPQVQAFIGDSVYSLYIRHRLVLDKGIKGSDLHNAVTNYVKAGGQSNFIGRILPILTEDEMYVFKRARNHKTLSQSKNASIVDYRRATGLEAVLGYLYLIGDENRLKELLEMSIGEKDEN